MRAAPATPMARFEMRRTVARMDFDEHIASTLLTATYPGVGSGGAQALSYVALGLAGESAEVLEKALDLGVLEEDAERRMALFVAELGDVAWYLSRFHHELGLDAPSFEHVPAGNVAELVVASGAVADQVKKALRDDAGAITPARLAAIATKLDQAVRAWLGVHQVWSLDPGETLDANIAKTRGRLARGTISGSGDVR